MDRDDAAIPPVEQLMGVAATMCDGYALLTVHGEIDLSTQGRLVTMVSNALEASGGQPVILDLSALTFLSSSGFGHLVALDQQANAVGVPLRIVIGDAWAVFQPFAVLGLDEVLSVFRTVDQAIVAGAP